ncbi:SDR family oxidoreductase [Nonomuraea sp. NPDC049709]|uniref:SDR family oxidoreductase n=1 Tax=Nonomuraea sp. NPDC049709 TaxID=3154736 RepID=UPI0034246B18
MARSQSAQWYAGSDRNAYIHRAWMRRGLPSDAFDGRPHIAIANTASGLTPCTMHLDEVAEHVKRGVWEAGGVPLNLPVVSLGETNVRPTAMLWRNMAAMAVEDMLRANPIDGVVLLGGCDKTIPALRMAAASVDLPAVVVPGGPMVTGTFRGAALGCGTDVWKLSEEVRAGTLSGKAAAIRLEADGIEVITLDVSEGADLVVDVTEAAAVQTAAEQVGPVDILVNSAGIVGPNAPLWEIPLDGWQRTFDVNVNGTFHTCRAFVPGMRERGWGRIINLASMAGKDGNPNMAPYSASKAAVIALTKSLGKELATSGVLVNAITPAVIETPMNADTGPEALAHITSLIPLRRVGKPEEVAELIAWLASDKVSFSTGAVYDISGGRATY